MPVPWNARHLLRTDSTTREGRAGVQEGLCTAFPMQSVSVSGTPFESIEPAGSRFDPPATFLVQLHPTESSLLVTRLDRGG